MSELCPLDDSELPLQISLITKKLVIRFIITNPINPLTYLI